MQNPSSKGVRLFKQHNVAAGTQTINNYLLGEIAIIVGILLLIVSPFTLVYPPFSIVLALSGLILVVARIFRIQLTRTVQNMSLIAMLLINLTFAIAFGRERSRLEEALRVEMVNERQAILSEEQRSDSLDICLQRIDDFYQKGEIDFALMELDKADLLAETPGEKADVNRIRIDVSLVKGKQLMKRRQYNMAIDLLTSVYGLDTNNIEVLYQRACCYVKTDRVADAAHDAKKAMIGGHEDAGKLYEKINPIENRIAYYCTVCKDGTYSKAVGQGACSYHGGIAKRNHPVYAKTRKYE